MKAVFSSLWGWLLVSVSFALTAKFLLLGWFPGALLGVPFVALFVLAGLLGARWVALASSGRDTELELAAGRRVSGLWVGLAPGALFVALVLLREGVVPGVELDLSLYRSRGESETTWSTGTAEPADAYEAARLLLPEGDGALVEGFRASVEERADEFADLDVSVRLEPLDPPGGLLPLVKQARVAFAGEVEVAGAGPDGPRMVLVEIGGTLERSMVGFLSRRQLRVLCGRAIGERFVRALEKAREQLAKA
ncbi:MAG: hypothetical protein AAF682_11360 [Planctomycetota bacterium]